MTLKNSDTWVIFCMGSSIKGRLEELEEHFKDWDNKIAVNYARDYFSTEYWAFLDHLKDCLKPEYQDRKIITSTSNREWIYRKSSKIPIYGVMGETTTNSGVFAVKYAKEQGAKNIITCGLDLTDGWEYCDGDGRGTSLGEIEPNRPHSECPPGLRSIKRTTIYQQKIKPKDKYAEMCRKSLKQLNNSTGCTIYSVDKDNILNLKYYDTKGVD
jgi:hypothetical protein